MSALLQRLFVLLSTWLALAGARVVSGRLTLSPQQPFQLVDYFTFDIGTGSIEFEGKAQQLPDERKPDVRLALIIDNEWGEALADGTCAGMLNRSRWGLVNYLTDRAPLQKKVTQRVRPYVWYLVATLCDAKKEVPLDYKVTFLNSDNSHFSFHEAPYPVLYAVLFVFCFAALLYVGFVCWQRMAKSTLMHRSALQLMAALALQALAFFLEMLHLTWYSYDGVGSPACDLLSDISGKLSQFMVAWTLLDLTWGWFHTTIAQEWKQTAAFGAMFAVFLTYLAIPVLARSSFGSAGVRVSHHEHDSWMGFLLMILKAVLCLAFGYGCMKTYRSEPSAQQQRFLQVFAVLGSAWFLAFPVIVVIAELVPPYYQHMASTIGVVLCQMIGLTFLCVLLLSNTDYYRLMTSADVLLPTSNKRL